MVSLRNIDRLSTKAREYLRKPDVVLKPTDSLATAVGKMKEHRIFDVVVADKNKLSGMISYDILMKRKKLPLTTKLKDIQIHPPRLFEDDSILKIAKAMINTGYRSVPVLSSNGRIKGIIRRDNFITMAREMELFKDVPAEEIMSTNPVVVNENDTITDVQRVMMNLQVRAIPVVDDKGRVSGVVGLNDIANYLFTPKSKETKGEVKGNKEKVQVRISSIMRTPAITIRPEDSVETALELMIDNDISTIVVTDNDLMPVGVVSQIDLIEAISMQEENENIDIQITGLNATDPIVASSVYEITSERIAKMSKLIPIKSLNLYVTEHHVKVPNEPPIYNFRGRLYTDRQMFYGNAESIEPFVALDEVLDSLDRQIKKYHDKIVDTKRKVK